MHFDAPPLGPSDREGGSDPGLERSSRLGLALFVVYLAAYAAFVGINAFWPSVMDATLLSGVNLAIIYGMALICGAFLLALLYAWLLRGSAK